MQKKSTAMPDLMNCKFSFGSCSRQNMYLSACVISFSVFFFFFFSVCSSLSSPLLSFAVN